MVKSKGGGEVPQSPGQKIFKTILKVQVVFGLSQQSCGSHRNSNLAKYPIFPTSLLRLKLSWGHDNNLVIYTGIEILQMMTMLKKLFCVLTANFSEGFDLTEDKRELF